MASGSLEVKVNVGVVGIVDPTFQAWAQDSLVWLPERGMGWLNVQANPYDQAYFDKYAGYADSEIGVSLTAARVALVARHTRGQVLDVGIGCGQFVAARPETVGFDVNPAGVDWLCERGLFANLYQGGRRWHAATFWDSLEHIPDPAAALAQVADWAFVSLPIFEDCAHVLRSKHFRRDEHFVYWTEAGFVDWMAAQGFGLVEANRMETALGREDIGTFAFRRAAG